MTTKIKISTALILVMGLNGVVFGYGLLFGHNYGSNNRIDLYDTKTSQVVASPFIKYSTSGTTDGKYTGEPTGVGVGPDGLIYVGSNSFGSIYAFSPLNGDVADIGTDILGRLWRESFSKPYYIRSSPNSDYLYWTNFYQSGNSSLASIYRYDTAARTAPEAFISPPDKSTAVMRGLAVSPDGTKLYAIARGARQVRVYDADTGSLLYTHNAPVEDYPGKGPETGIFGPDGYLYVGFWNDGATEANEAQIVIWDVSTTPWTQVGSINDDANYYTWAMHYLYDMTFDPDGRLYVSNRDKQYYTSRVLIFENDGAGYEPSNWTKHAGPDAEYPLGLAWLADAFKNTIKITSLVVVDSRRIGEYQYEYDVRLNIQNNGEGFDDMYFKLVGLPENVSIGSGSSDGVNTGSMPQFSEKLCQDVITLVIERSIVTDVTQLSWELRLPSIEPQNIIMLTSELRLTNFGDDGFGMSELYEVADKWLSDDPVTDKNNDGVVNYIDIAIISSN